MRRREPLTPATPTMPPHLATFDEADWPGPPTDWPAEIPARGYRRIAWQRARRQWRRATPQGDRP